MPLKNIAVIGQERVSVRIDQANELVVEDDHDLVAIQLTPDTAHAMLDCIAGYLQGLKKGDRL